MVDDFETFEKFYKSNFKFIFCYIFRRIPIREDCEDIVADVFGAIYKVWPQLDRNGNIKGYLFKLTQNKLNSFLREKYRINLTFSNREIDNLEENSEEWFNEKQSLLKILDHLVSRLNSKEIIFFNLKYRDKLSYSKIADKLEITRSNAKVINNRLVKKLKNLWTQIASN